MLKFKELESLVEKWAKTGLLESFVNKTPIALCLHSQIRLNEKLDLDPQFRRWSVPMLIRAFTESKAFQRNNFTNLFEDLKEPPNIMFLKTAFVPTQPHDSLDHEAELVAQLAKSFKEEIDACFRDRKGATVVFHGISHTPEGKLVLHYN